MTCDYWTPPKAVCDDNPDNIFAYAVLHTVIPCKKMGNSFDCKNHGGPAS